MSNEAAKKNISLRAKKVGERVQKYVEEALLGKIDQAGDAAGIWLESLKSHFDKLKPEGAMKGFTTEDFDDLYFVLTGHKRKTAKDRIARIAELVATHPLDRTQKGAWAGVDMPEENYHRRVFHALWRIIEGAKRISEKNFEGQDWIKAECDRIVRSAETDEVIRRFEADGQRPEYCAECVFAKLQRD